MGALSFGTAGALIMIFAWMALIVPVAFGNGAQNGEWSRLTGQI